MRGGRETEHMHLRIFAGSYAVTAVSLVVAFVYGGVEGLILCAILERMDEWWQRIFLTVGVLIAVFGMRLVFPLLIVAITAGLSPFESLDLALQRLPVEDPASYAFK